MCNIPEGAKGFSDLGDDEFALRVLAGINPLNIERLTVSLCKHGFLSPEVVFIYKLLVKFC